MIEANDAVLNHVVSDVFFKDVLLHSKDLVFILSKREATQRFGAEVGNNLTF